MEKTKTKSPFIRWRDSLEVGDLMWVISYNRAFLAVFKAFRPGCNSYNGHRLEYYDLPSIHDGGNGYGRNSWLEDRIEHWEKGDGKPYVSYIHSAGKERILPLSSHMLPDETAKYYKRLQKLIR